MQERLPSQNMKENHGKVKQDNIHYVICIANDIVVYMVSHQGRHII